MVEPAVARQAVAGLEIRRAHLAAGDIVRRRGLPLTSPVRTCFDIARSTPLVEATTVVDQALHRNLTSLQVLREYVNATAWAQTTGDKTASCAAATRFFTIPPLICTAGQTTSTG
jgi:hypothetical protein